MVGWEWEEVYLSSAFVGTMTSHGFRQFYEFLQVDWATFLTYWEVAKIGPDGFFPIPDFLVQTWSRLGPD